MVVRDQELIRDLQDGSDLAFVTLYNRYKQAAYVYCLKMLGDVDAAKDIVQGTFLKVYERRSQLRFPERFKAWLLKIARNECLTDVIDEPESTVKSRLFTARQQLYELLKPMFDERR